MRDDLGDDGLGALALLRHADAGGNGAAGVEPYGAAVLRRDGRAADAQLQARTDLVADLLSGRADRRAVVTAACTLGVDLMAPCCVLVATAPDAGTSRRSLVLAVAAALGGGALVAEHRGDLGALAARIGRAKRLDGRLRRSEAAVPDRLGCRGGGGRRQRGEDCQKQAAHSS